MSNRMILAIVAAVGLIALQGCDSKSGGTEPGKEIETDLTVTDIDGNVYHTVTIGTQVWTVENLKVTKYRNGDPIPNVTDGSVWAALTTGAYYNIGNDSSFVSTYGRLYNWFAVTDSRNIAPAGWHVPTDAEWQTLINYLGGSFVAGGKMKEAGITHWNSPNAGATNVSGFSALPASYRNYDGNFYGIGGYAYFWSSSEKASNYAWSVFLYYDFSDARQFDNYERYGFSVRLVRDQTI